MTVRPDWSGFEIEFEPSGRTVSVSGELDSGTSDELLQTVHDRLVGLDSLVLDLRRVAFIDSTGTRAIILLERESARRGVRLEVVPPPQEVTALLRLAGVTERIHLASSPDQPAVAEGFRERVEHELERNRDAPAKARAEVRDVLDSELAQPELATMVLLTSELVTNAVLHPRDERDQRIGLCLTVYPSRIRVEVDDAGAGFDPADPVEATDRGGRGLMLVDQAASRWGATRRQTARGERFCVWFELELDVPAPRAG
jgi:anti-anti-sigma factor